MNVSELMSDGPTTAEYDTAAATESAPGKPGSWNGKKSQEEYDAVKARLFHQDFNPTDYPDPLLRRKDAKNPYSGNFPSDAEARLKKIFEAAAPRT